VRYCNTDCITWNNQCGLEVSVKRRLVFTRLNGGTSRKAVTLTLAAVRIWYFI
jgi:hypothetical protein